LAPQIDALLSSLRRRIHAYVWMQGLALAIAWLGAAFWITLALDWWIEPPVLARQIMLVAVGIVLLYLIYRFILRRAFVRLADTNLALLLERRFRNFGDSLVTTVELADHPDHATGFNPQMLAHTQRDALKRLPEVELGDVFRPGPLAAAIFGAGAAVVSVGLFAIFAWDLFGIFGDRMLGSNRLYPRQTHLAIEGFENGRIKVAKGSDVEIIALADTHFKVPDTVQIRYRTDEGKSRENMSRLGVAEPTDKYQKYSFTFRGILSSRSFDLAGGDAVLRDYQIDVVDVPTIEMTLQCKYPDYMRRDPRDLPVTGIMQIPQGTKVTVQAKANKDLVEVPVSMLVGDKTQAGERIRLADARDRRHFTYEIPQLDDDQILFFTLVDVDGIRTKEPIRLSLNATPDEPPHVGLHLRAIGTSITPQARLPVEGEVTDDYGVAKIWFEYKLDQGDATQTPFRANPRSRPTIKCDRAADEALDFKEKSLKIGQQVSLAMMAEDNRSLKGGPNVASSERYQLAVVAPDQLMSMLEARELTLRLRLEQISQDLTSTRDALGQLDFTPPKPAPSNEKPAAPKPASEKRASTIRAAVDPFVAADGANGKSSANPSGAEPDDARKSNGASNDGLEPGESNTPGPNRGLKSAPVVIEQTLAYSERGASETTSLAGAFDDIREEMVNNRIDTPAIEYRLRDGIADPLRHIAEVSFPELDRRLKTLQAALADPQAAKARHAAALKQIDDILREMQQVMSKMLELESFNQIVQDLRKIITEQEELNRLTQKLQKLKALSPND
jgi:hypothetical protein